MSDAEAYAAFQEVRFADNGGEPRCPKCRSVNVYTFQSRAIFKCKGCQSQFSLTTGTIFASRKMAIRDILLAIAIFVNGSSGVSALRLGRELNCSYKTAYVLCHKLRELMGSMRVDQKLTGTVEVDGVFVGGWVKPGNVGSKGKKTRTVKTEKRRMVITMRERRQGGRTLTFVANDEYDAHELILAHIDRSASLRTDLHPAWDGLPLLYPKHRAINHSYSYSDGKSVHTNWAESFHSRLRRAERGVYHRISGRYLGYYADEMAWREDFRRTDNGRQFGMIKRAAVQHPVSREWKGFWQRRKPKAAGSAPSA